MNGNASSFIAPMNSHGRYRLRSGDESAWNWQELSRYFLRLATNAQRKMWQLKDVVAHDAASQDDYDRALAVYSVCHRLWGQPFLRDRECLLMALDRLMGEVKAEGSPFDEDRFVQRWRDVVTALRWRYG